MSIQFVDIGILFENQFRDILAYEFKYPVIDILPHLELSQHDFQEAEIFGLLETCQPPTLLEDVIKPIFTRRVNLIE